jgi:hypothetical protein
MTTKYLILCFGTLIICSSEAKSQVGTGIDTGSFIQRSVSPASPRDLRLRNSRSQESINTDVPGNDASTSGTSLSGSVNYDSDNPSDAYDYNQSLLLIPEEEDNLISNPEAEAAYWKSSISYYELIAAKNKSEQLRLDTVLSYNQWALSNRKEVLIRQQSTGRIIFVLVVILVLSGLLFSGIQFYIAANSSRNKESHQESTTTLKASLSGIEVSSSIIGLLILVISIAFFYLYLTNVFTLTSLDQSAVL